MTRDDDHDELSTIAALGDPSRRALYEFVVAAGRAVGRDEAAAALGLERGTATHHLERLAGEGLLDVEYRRLTGRRGPGAGRPAKLYRRSSRQFDVSLPPRDYEFAGRILAEAVDQARTSGVGVEATLRNACTSEGRRIAARILDSLRRGAGRRARQAAVLSELEALGYEPEATKDGTVRLRNCPFHQLAQEHTDLVCGMNLCVLDAAASEVDAGFEARLEPEEGFCCVRFSTRS
jgi:predicted ArsR family transcriptional regulator